MACRDELQQSDIAGFKERLRDLHQLLCRKRVISYNM